MNKIVSALLVGLFAVSVNAFAADAAPAAVKAEATPAAAAPAADVAKHTAAPANNADTILFMVKSLKLNK